MDLPVGQHVAGDLRGLLVRAEVPGRYRLTDSGLGHAQRGAVAELIIEGSENPAVFTPQH